MRLRLQLLLLSLLTLALPWAGCQYIQEVDRALRTGQASALAATAQAIAARLSAEPDLLISGSRSAGLESQLYVHPLSFPLVVDGYTGDWRELALTPRRFRHRDDPAFRAQFSLASDAAYLYLLAEVSTPKLSYHDPGQPELASGDHLVLASGADVGLSRYYVISAEAPGPINVTFRDAQGQIQREHRIRGHWQETDNGYRVELQMPLNLAGDSLALAAVTRDGTPRMLGTLSEEALLAGQAQDPGLLPPVSGKLIYPSKDIEAALAVFAQPGVRLTLTDPLGWELASVGDLNQTAEQQPQVHWLLRHIYRAALPTGELPELPVSRTGLNHHPALINALGGETTRQWHQRGTQRIGAAATMIQQDPAKVSAVEDIMLGAILVEQSSDAMQALTETAFVRLLSIGLGTMVLLILTLLGYASWLSWRIRRLNQSVKNLFDSEGRVGRAQARGSRAPDEIGDLARNYEALHQRLQAYTGYLKTLAAKLSHELRTPLAVVRSSLDNLEHQALPSAAREYTERAQSGVNRLSGLVTAMSEASRVEASIARAEREPLPLDQLLRDMTAAYRDLHRQHRIELEIAPPSTPHAYTQELAPDLIVQLLDKLMDNAVDFCPEGEEIRLTLTRAPNSGDLHLSVANQGPLLPEAMESQLFDSLVSVRPLGQERAHLGLGLHIARLIAHYHSGEVRAANLPDGSGVVFTLILPPLDAIGPESGSQPQKGTPGVDTGV
ncbi:ATP-binding protein [Marinimicrobium sp. ABcell2]|uniref:ATP-binding protein n=1 Tax=Marinimicrobium sp. ABcell2 TaxID=3069751 RepID=UPI0027B05200|nr:ATP-binding protein [Marinimicrobium sp. ABcell2]MDQ2077716.1 histidine kinase dimerization/phospho-acceptor domain-containing protein [Marinimicrobium sp. ABcell2]